MGKRSGAKAAASSGSNQVTCSRVTASGSGCPSGPRRSFVQASAQMTTEPVVKVRPSSSVTSSSPAWSSIDETRASSSSSAPACRASPWWAALPCSGSAIPASAWKIARVSGSRRQAGQRRATSTPSSHSNATPAAAIEVGVVVDRLRGVRRGQVEAAGHRQDLPPGRGLHLAPRGLCLDRELDVLGAVVGQAGDPGRRPATRRGRGRARTARGRGPADRPAMPRGGRRPRFRCRPAR